MTSELQRTRNITRNLLLKDIGQLVETLMRLQGEVIGDDPGNVDSIDRETETATKELAMCSLVAAKYKHAMIAHGDACEAAMTRRAS